MGHDSERAALIYHHEARGADNANEVAKRAIALLLSAQGKEILLRDRNGKVEAVEV